MKHAIGIIAILVVVVGIWYAISDRAVAPTVSESPSPEVSVAVSVTPTSSVAAVNTTPKPSAGPVAYTATQVAVHNSQSSCWSIIRGSVYDLTLYIPRHPGGPQKILAICGKDGTSLFVDQHGGNQKQENMLATLKIGTLAE